MRRSPTGKTPADSDRIVSDTADLKRLCERLAREPFVCVDTEFMREKTFWPILCLVQLAGPDGEAFAVDALAPGIDLAPLDRLLNDAAPIKVFHACRQDVEIFFARTGRVPAPLYDTQVAAMACGFGNSAGYESLVRELAGVEIDKSDRFSDWSKRPLSGTQLRYALGDVIHLPKVYSRLVEDLEEDGRTSWVEAEMETLRDASSYTLDPAGAWKRAKIPNLPPRARAIAHALAAAREELAQDHDRPRRWILRDDVMAQIARAAPKSPEELGGIRGLSPKFASGSMGRRILKAVAEGSAAPPPPKREKTKKGCTGPVGDLLRVLLQKCAAEHGLAPKLVASAADLDRIAAGATDVPALQGWRNEVFGKRAKALCEGKVGLMARKGRLQVFRLAEDEDKGAEQKKAKPSGTSGKP